MKPEQFIKKVIQLIGDDPNSEHCKDTPKRVVKSWQELYSGYKSSPEDALGTVFKSNGHNQMVICKDIEFYSMCSHHMLPFFGKAHIGYIPRSNIVGLSKLARLVDVYARRLQVQERMTDQISGAIDKILTPQGVIVVVEAKHLCMCARGVKKQNSVMVTSSICGALKNEDARAEFMSLIK